MPERRQRRLHLDQSRIKLAAFFLSLGQSLQRIVVLNVGRLQFSFQRCPLPIELRATFLGRSDRETNLGQCIDGLPMFGVMLIDLFLLFRNLFSQRGEILLRRIDGRLRIDQLRLQRPQLAAARNKPRRCVSRSDDQRTIRLEQLTGKCDIAQPSSNRMGQLQSVRQIFNKPRAAQQSLSQRNKSRLRFDKAIGAAQNARTSFQVDFIHPLSFRERARVRAFGEPSPHPLSFALRNRNTQVEPEKAHPAAKPARFRLQEVEQLDALIHHDMLRCLPQRNFNQRSRFNADVKHIGHKSANGTKHSVGGIGGPGQHFLHARAQSFMPAHEFVQDRGSLGRGAVSLTEFRQLILLIALSPAKFRESVLRLGRALGQMLGSLNSLLARSSQLV